MRALLAAMSCSLVFASACSKPTRAENTCASGPGATTPIGPVAGPKVGRIEIENPYEGESAAANAGRAAFVQFNCYGCHGYHGGGGMAPSLRDEDWIYGGAPVQIYDTIFRGGANGMPSWGSRLPDSQIWQLVTYIRTLGKDNETDPPR
jgi:cytochrome c oxidase cbb3-type subunit 3